MEVEKKNGARWLFINVVFVYGFFIFILFWSIGKWEVFLGVYKKAPTDAAAAKHQSAEIWNSNARRMWFLLQTRGGFKIGSSRIYVREATASSWCNEWPIKSRARFLETRKTIDVPFYRENMNF